MGPLPFAVQWRAAMVRRVAVRVNPLRFCPRL
jgi:hypothetical protein